MGSPTRRAFVLPDGTEVPFRLTAVVPAGGWRMADPVQAHASIAVGNEEVLGTEL